MPNLLFSGSTHTGMRRKENEDAFICRTLWGPETLLLAAIDGVGGYAGGAVAALLARESIEQYMQEPKGDVLTMLREAVVFANNQITAARESTPAYADMCCVLTVAAFDLQSGQLHYVHVGDSRLYHNNRSKLHKITHDHSLVGMQEDAGEITEQEAMSHPHRHMILREVGSSVHRVDDPGFLDFGSITLQPGDEILLCSDGLSDMLSAFELRAILQQPIALDKKVEKLIRKANEAGGHDNITVVMARYPAGKPKRPAGNKMTQSRAGNHPSSNNPSVAAPVETTGPKERPSRQVWFMIALLAVLLLASGWIYFHNGHEQAQPPRKDSITTIPKDSIRQPVSATVPATDTLVIEHALSRAEWQQRRDASSGQLVLIPAPGKNRHAAIDLNRDANSAPDTLTFDRVTLRGFDTGIISRMNIYLRLNNTAFDSVKNPVIISHKR
ncbi:PP2C family protein-serine/threonine phosphatase [Flavihumibacter petaseus]|uniref:Protein phosphatase n=1 Tax=Flavihumibacter petaseus NBRC 106054 TaxID=1220578 RepID=A0A0E9MU15_9BACT|nr:protein phosphatase 2C domain-containing protein [Flavihumibacter petaseus]GAO41059.1 protein phosphatase [Flavihumibacter petaseus NBRC 106054]